MTGNGEYQNWNLSTQVDIEQSISIEQIPLNRFKRGEFDVTYMDSAHKWIFSRTEYCETLLTRPGKCEHDTGISQCTRKM